MSIKIKGKVIAGKKLGRKLGFPTLNVAYNGKLSGVYLGEVFLKGKRYPAAIHAGNSLVEAHLLDFKEFVSSGTEIEIALLKKIRETRKFPNLENLKKQISKDVEFAKNWYNSKRK